MRKSVLTARPPRHRRPRQLGLFGKRARHKAKAPERPAVKTRCTFAKLMRSTFDADVETCQRCGHGPLRYLGPVTDPAAIEALLAAVAGQPDSMPPPAPTARGPPQLEMVFRKAPTVVQPSTADAPARSRSPMTVP